MTEQMTVSLKAANGPPASTTPTSQANLVDLQNFIVSTLSGQSGSYTGTQSLSSAGIGSFLQLNGLTLTFSATQDANSKAWSGTVSISATSGAIYSGKQFSATVGAVTGSYKIDATGQGAKTFSLTASSFAMQIGEALKITSPSVSLTYDASSSAAQTIATISNATASSPQFPSLPTATLTNFNLRTDGFSFDDFTLSKTFSAGSPLTLGSFLEVSGKVSLIITGGLAQNGTTTLPFNLSYSSPKDSTAGIEFTADSIRLFPGIAALNLQFDSITGIYNIINTVNTGTSANPVYVSSIGSGNLGISLSNVDISVGDAFIIHLGDITLQPGQATMASVSDASISSKLVSGFGEVSIGSFDLTQQGFALTNVNFGSLLTVSIGGFLELQDASFKINSFSLDNGVLSSDISLTVGGLELFPGNANISSSFTHLQFQFDLSSATGTGALTITADSFSLSLANQLTISADTITLTPGRATILDLVSAQVLFAPLNGLVGNINGLTIQDNGFTLSSATFTSQNVDFDLGGVVSFASAPGITLTDVSYTIGGDLGGVVSFDPITVGLDFGVATAAGTFSGDYNLKTGVLNAAIDSFSLNIPGFISINGSNIVLSYQPATDGSAKFDVGAAGVTVLMGDDSGPNAVGVQIGDATLALVIFKAASGNGGGITYALDASGSISLVGLPADTLSFTANNVEVRANNTGGTVDEMVNVDSNPDNAVHVYFTANEQSLMASGLTLTVGSLVTVQGDFAFQAFTDPDTNLTDVAIAAANVSAVLGNSTTNLTISGASLGLVILPTTSGTSTYALVANGGTDTLNGVTGLSVSASGLTVKVNTTGLDLTTNSAVPASIQTPGGLVDLDFTGLGSGDVIAVEGAISLNIAGFVSLQGDFAFQTFTDVNNANDIAIGAKNINLTLGTDSTNLSITGASLYVVIIPGTANTAATYALVVNGGVDQLNGVTGLSLSASDLRVRINTTGVDPTTLGAPTTLPTPDGDIAVDFTGMGAGNTKDIQGALTLTVLDFITLQGSFGFQSFTDSSTGLTNIAIGATGISAKLGTDTTYLQIDGASLGILIIASAGGSGSSYALVANGGTDTLHGIPGLNISASGLSVKINNLGLDPTTVAGAPTSVQTPGGEVALTFDGLGAGPSKIVEGTITLDVVGFVSLEGSFSFQTFTDLVTGKTDIAIGATGVNATLTVGNVALTIDDASLGLLIIPGVTADTGTYALVANGGADTLTGIDALSVSASGLKVRINNTGLDLASHVGSTTIETPGGSVALDFSDLGSGAVTSIEGSITLNIAGFVSLSGDFGFQKYTDNGETRMLIGATNVNVLLGTAQTNVSIIGASLGIILLPGANGNPGTYALMANGGTAALNGVPGLTLTTDGLSVKVNTTGLAPETLAAMPVHTSGGDVTLDFTGLGSGNVTQIAGTVTLDVAGFVSISGSFVFTKQVDPNDANITEIIVGASGVTAFLGAADKSFGVQIANANLGLVIYKNALDSTSTYALYASSQIQLVGLPTEIQISGALGLAINNTGKAVDETITTPGGDVNVNFTDGTNGSLDQRNLKSFFGSLSLTINAGTPFTLAGDFSFSRTGTAPNTKLLIGAANVSSSNILPDGASASVTVNGGTLGLVIFSGGAGYALTASATVVASGGNSSASATLTLRRNTTVSAVNETVTVGTASVPVIFSSAEVKAGTTAFQKISVSDASLNIDNTLIITAGTGNTSSSGGITTKTLTDVSLTLQDPDTGNVLFVIAAGSAEYVTITAGKTYDGLTWTNGGTEVLLHDLSFSLGALVTFTGNSVTIRHYVNAASQTVNSFNFSGATISLYWNGAPMAALQGNLAFHFSQADGFKLDSTGALPITGFSFLGQSIGGVTAPAATTSGTGFSASAVPPPATHTLGPITLGTPSVGFSNFSFSLDGSLSVTVSISDTLAAINVGVVSAKVTNITGSFDLGLKINLADPLALPTNITASGFTLKADKFEINVGSYLTLTATGSVQTPLLFNPSAGATQDLISFGSLSATLHVGALNITGGASNFAIEGDGSFVTKPNFAVSIGLGANDAGSVQWPSWLPLQSASVTLVWTDFNAHPDQFLIQFSATIHASLGGLDLDGSVTNAVIDPQLLSQGKFPIISVGAIGVGVSGNLFGGEIEGQLLAGIVRFDAAGHVVDNLGFIQGTTTPATGDITSVFYAGVDGGITIGGTIGLNIRIGLSQFGPLQLYVDLKTEVPLGNTGLFLTGLRGGISFGATFPTINITGSPSDALQLRQPGFGTPSSLTLAQWQAQLVNQVVTLYRAGAATDGFAALANTPVLIQAGVSIAAANANVFRLDGDLIFSTDGKFLVLGTATFGDSLSVGVKIFTDLSPLFNLISQPADSISLSVLFLMEVPGQPNTLNLPPVYSVYGVATFAIDAVNDTFSVTLGGAEDLNLLGGFTVHAEGTIKLTFTSTYFQLDLSHVSMSVSYLGEIGEATGSMIIQTNTGGLPDIWGGLLLIPNLTKLEAVGIHAAGQIYFQFNTTTQLKQLPLVFTSQTVTLNIQPLSFALFVQGSAAFDVGGFHVFDLSGTLAFNLNLDVSGPEPAFTMTLFVNAQLNLGPEGATLLKFSASGLIYIDQNGFAAKMNLVYAGSPLTGFSIGANWLLVMNTTGETISYAIPTPLPTSPPSSPVATVTGPDFSSPNVMATISYETVVDGQRTLVIPDGAPPQGTTNFVSWTADAASPYFILLGRGNLTIGSLKIFGTLNVLATIDSVTGLQFSLQVNGGLNLAVNGTNLFSFTVAGAVEINSSGLVAALSMNLASGFSLPSGLGFSLSASFTLQVNTTGSAVTVTGTGITVQPGAMVAARGSMSISGFSITGEFDLTINASKLAVHVDATLNLLGVTLTVRGDSAIYYDTDPGFVLNLSLTVGTGANCTLYPVSSLGNNFVLQGNLTLQINTCSQTRDGVASGFLISVNNLSVYLFHFSLTGSASFKLSSSGAFTLSLSLDLNLADIVKMHFTGTVNSNGTFYISATTSFQYDWSIKIFSGYVYANFTVSFWNYGGSNWGFYASAGCGIHVDGIGSLSASASLYIDGSGHFKLSVGVDIGICDVTVDIDLGPSASPPAPPPSPILARVVNGVLYLNLGADVSHRDDANSPNVYFGAQTAENYSLTESNGVITVTALGYTQQINTNIITVSSIAVTNTLTGNDTITLDNSVWQPFTITLGSGNNIITTGGGYATVYDYGTGANVINGGTGGGIYHGGLQGGITAYASKGLTTINSGGNFVVAMSGYAKYILSASVLQYGSYLLNVNGVSSVTLNAGSSATANTFTFLGWKGSATVNGLGSDNTIVVNPLGGTSAATFVLTDTSLSLTVGAVTSTFTLSGIQTANLTGDAKGANTYTVSGWTGNGSLTGPGGSTNTVIAVNNVNFGLTNTGLSRSGLPTLGLSGIQNAQLTGGAGVNVFTLTTWSGNATLTGVNGNDTYNVTLTGADAETVTVADAAPNSNDSLNLTVGASTIVTANQVAVAAQLVNYTGVKTLNVTGTAAGLSYAIRSTNATTTTTINSLGSGNIFSLGSTAGTTPATAGNLDGILGDLILNGTGQDELNLDDSGGSTGRTGIMTPTTINFVGLGQITYLGMTNVAVALSQGADSFTIVDTITSSSTTPVVVVNANDGNDVVNVLNTHAVTTVNGGAGNDTFFIFSNASALNLNGQAGDDGFNLMAAVVAGSQNYLQNAAVVVDGGTGAADVLNLFGTVLNDLINLDGSRFTDLGLDISFSNLTGWNISALGGNDTFRVVSVVVPTTLAGDGELPVLLLPTGVNAPDLTGGNAALSFDDSFFIGWRGDSAPGSLEAINAALTIQGGQGNDVAFVNDAADTANRSFALTPGVLNSDAMGPNGRINYDASLETLNVLLGAGDDALTINDMIPTTVTTLDGGLGNNAAAMNFSGDFAATDLTLLNFQTNSLNVAGNFTGLLNDQGAFPTVTIGGSLTTTGIFNAGSIDTMTVGGDLAGLLNVTGLLNTLAIGGGSPGKIIAGAINYVSVQSAFGNKVFQVIEGGVERQIQATPVNGGQMPDAIRYAFLYDSSAPGDPQLVLSITNTGGVSPRSFNLLLAVLNADAQFNLGLAYASAATGLSNLSVEGDILFTASQAGMNFLGLPTTARTGVVLPFDYMTGVEVSGILPIGLVQAAGIEGVAFGLVETLNGQAVNIFGDLRAAGKTPKVLWNLLGSQPVLLPGTDAFVVPFAAAHAVQLFAQCNTNQTLEYVATFSASNNGGIADVATVTIVNGNKPTINSISILGDGASVDSRYGVGDITSTGSLGDVTVRGKEGLGSITASGIFGNLNITAGAVTGTIETTDIRIDPVTGDQTSVNADIGAFTYNAHGEISGVTTIFAKKGFTNANAIICRGDLISSLNLKGVFNGTIAVQGNVGVLLTDLSGSPLLDNAGKLERLGGISISRMTGGQIIVLGNTYGDITLGGLFGGRIAVQGASVSGLDATRTGILGNLQIRSGLAAGGAVISGGLIGDAAGGTKLSSGKIKGFLAANGAVTLANSKVIAAANLFANAEATASGAVLDAIFTDQSTPLHFDTGGPLAGLALIQSDLATIGIVDGQLAGTTP